MRYILSALIFFLFFCQQLIAQNAKRNEDGSLKKEIDYVSLLCNKEWKWDEGIVGNAPYESAVFSLEYDTNKTFRYNQRAEKNYWRISGNHLIHSIAPFGQKKKNPFGIFEGRYEITRITDSVLVLTKVDGKPGNPANTLKFCLIPKVNHSLVTGYNSINKVPETIVPLPEELNKFLLTPICVNESGAVTPSSQFKKYPNGKTIETIQGTNYTLTRIIFKKLNIPLAVFERKEFSDSTETIYSLNGKIISKEEFDTALAE